MHTHDYHHYTNHIFITLLLLISAAYAANDVIVKNLKLFVDGKEFHIQGMCYSPTPLGVTTNGGFCSYKQTPFKTNDANNPYDYESACFDSDFFDGSGDNPNRNPPGPPGGGWFQPLWQRDFPHMVTLGINTVRIYLTNPTTHLATVQDPTTYYPYGKDHTEFLDTAASFGLKVIYPLIGDYNLMKNTDTAAYETLLMNQINEVGNHPAILMFTLGNELDFTVTDTINKVNYYMNFSRSYMQSKWGRFVPITTAIVDNPDLYDSLAAALKVDVFTSNAGYRGSNYQDLWSGNSRTIGWKKLSCQYNVPLFIGEVGWLSDNNGADYANPNWFNTKYQDEAAHIDQGCIGSAFFEYSDEANKQDPLQQNLGVVTVSKNVQRNQANTGDVDSTQANVWLADIVSPKPLLYNWLINGTAGGMPYNYQTNVYLLLGRSQYTTANVPDFCSANTAQTVGSSSITQSTRATTATVSTTATVGTTTSSATQATSATTATVGTSSATTATVTSSATVGPTSTTKVTSATTANIATSSSTNRATTTAKVTSSTRATTTAKVASTSTTKASTSSGTTTTSKATSATTGSAATTGTFATCPECGTMPCCQQASGPACYDPKCYSCPNRVLLQTGNC